MTYPINPNIPAANNDPADDQPEMQTNFSNINQYVQVDHTNPSNVGAGEHKQVTFNDNNVPSGFPITPPILFTNDQDGAGNNLPGSLAHLFFYTGSAASSKNNYVSAATGSVMVQGGIIFKWGTININNPAVAVVFVSPFPNNCFTVHLQPFDTAYTGTAVPTSVTTTGFSARRQSGTGNTGAYYLAVGN